MQDDGRVAGAPVEGGIADVFLCETHTVTPYEAGQQLGTLLFGQQPSAGNPDGSPSLYDAATGNVPRGSAYYNALATGGRAYEAVAQVGNVMAQARTNRAKAVMAEQQQAARAQYKQAYLAAGGDPKQADFVADSALAADSSNPEQLFALLPRSRAYGAAQLGDDALMNRNIAVSAGKPLKLSATNGGITTTNPYTSPVVAPNALGDAAIQARQAAAVASYASAVRQRAGIGADKAGNYALETDAGGNMVRVNKLTGEVSPLTTAPNVPLKAAPKGRGASAQDTQTIAGFRERIAAGKATPAQVAAFLVKQGRPDLAKQIYNPAYFVGPDGGGE